MNIYEIGLKIVIDITLALIIIVASPLDYNIIGVMFSLFLAHTVNWILNGHWFVLMRYVKPVPRKREVFDRYVEKMRYRTQNYFFIDSIGVFGSYCANRIHDNSDLDVRVLVRPGVLSGVLGALHCAAERFLAFFSKFPLDIYACNNLDYLKMNPSENPVILFDRSGRLRGRYPNSKIL